MCHFERSAPVSGGDGTSFEQVIFPGQEVELPAFLSRPAVENAPAVLIIHDVHGPNLFYQDLTRRMANEGFIALLPDYFVRQGPPADDSREAIMNRSGQLDEAIVLSDMSLTLSWMASTLSPHVGVIGFCMGGTLALLAAGRAPLPAAVVAYYGFPAGRKGWSHVPTEEVHQLAAPLLALWGDQDAGVGMDNVATWQKAVNEGGKDAESVIYPGLPHGFLTFDPASPNYEGAQNSWTRTLSFLREKLSS